MSALVSICMVLCALSVARASPAAELLLEQGKALYAEGLLRQAIERLEQARKQSKEAKQLGQILLYAGLSHDGDGNSSGAEGAFREALHHDPTLEIDPDRFKPSVVELFLRVRSSLRGTLEVAVLRDGVQLVVDGKAATSPFRSEVAIGVHRIEIRLSDGTAVLAEDAMVFPGRLTTLRLPPAAATHPARAAATQPTATATAAPAVAPSVRPASNPRQRPPRLWTWITAGAAATAAAIAIGFGVAAAIRQDEGEALLEGGLSPEDLDRFEELSASHDTAKTVAWATGIASAVLAAGAVVLYFVEGRRGNEPSARLDTLPMGVVLQVGIGTGGLCMRF